MKRRELLAGMSGWAAVQMIAAPAKAQGRPGVARIGWLSGGTMQTNQPFLDALRLGLNELGYVEGRNLVIEIRSADGSSDRLPELAEELVRLPVEVVVTQGAAVWGMVKIGSPVPVVYGFSGDPILAGFADSLAQPRGNLTGQTFMQVDLNGKRLELLREILPTLQRIAVIANPVHPGEHLERADSEDMTRQLGLSMRYLPVRSSTDLGAALSAVADEPPEAIVLFPDGVTVQHRARIIDFALERRIPVISGWALFARSGGLFTYGPRLEASYGRLAYYVDRILKGTKPSGLPIERPTVFELVLNQGTARSLGITFPPSLLARADEVIE